MNTELTYERAIDLFDYNPDTGILTRKIITARRTKVGDEVGKVNASTGNEYKRVGCDGEMYRVHRVIYLIMTGALPNNILDHIDGNPGNNKWENIRDSTDLENSRNQRLSKINTSGFCGVYWNNENSKWRAKISLNGTLKHLGYFTDKQDAIKARQMANIKYGFSPRHGTE